MNPSDNHNNSKRLKLIEDATCDVEKWYSRLRGLTFETQVLNLTGEEVEAMIAHYQYYALKRTKVVSASSGAFLSKEYTKQMIDKLCDKLQSVMSNCSDDGSSQGFFVRLGSRSPKDIVFLEGTSANEYMRNQMIQNMKQYYRERTVVQLDNNFSRDDFNKEYTMLVQTMIHAMRVENARQAMNCLLESERVFCDLLLYSSFPDLEQPTIIVRLFNNKLQYSNEFRCFVYKNELTAITQYDNLAYFPHLVINRELYSQAIRNFFYTKVRDCFRDTNFPESYIIDFAIIDSNMNNNDMTEKNLNDIQVVVIELNAFNARTGASLFDWRSDKDILEGKSNLLFEFRINTSIPIENYEEHIDPSWWNFLSQTRNEIVRTKNKEESQNWMTSYCSIL